MAEIPPAEVILRWNNEIIDNFRANNGRVVDRDGFEGGNMIVLLTTTGAKTGAPRTSPLAYATIDGRVLIVASHAGIDRDPNWVHNLRADRRAHVEIGTEAYTVTVRELSVRDRDEVWRRLIDAVPRWADYQTSTTRVLPVFELLRT